MKSFILCLFVGVATAAQLPNSYIPPNRNSAGGNGQFLQAPRGGQQPSNQYIPPTSGSGYDASAQNNQYAGQNVNRGATTYASSQDALATILKYENNPNIGDGTYSYEFETSNGIKVQESGYNTQQGEENSEQVVTGSYSYIGDDGQTYTVTYKADANGFQPEGAHLPTPPPIPEAIQKSLDLIAASNARGGNNNNNQQNSYNRNAQGGQGGQAGQGYASQQSQSYLPPNQQSYDTQQGYRY